MQNNFAYYGRKLVRLQGYDYSLPGVYFITICSYKGENTFSVIEKGRVFLTPLGRLIKKWLVEVENKFKSVFLDKYVIMPNHLHIIFIFRHGAASQSNLWIRTNYSSGLLHHPFSYKIFFPLYFGRE